MEFPRTGRGTAKPLSEWDKKQDNHGITNPNLHRRVDSKQPPVSYDETLFPRVDREVLPRDYHFTIQGHNSYRNTKNHIQDDNSDVSEVP